MDQIQQIQIRKPADAEELAEMTLKVFIDSAEKAIHNRGVFRVALSGGSTPVRFYEKLSDISKHSEIQWNKVHIFWVDERCVPPSSNASNFGLATHTFLLDIPIPGENIHRMAGEYENYADAVDEYERVIRAVFNLSAGQLPQFDMILLGMGVDGHIGSIFPNTYAQFDTDAIVSAVYRMDGNYNRITLTIPVIKEARCIVILVSGPNKAQIVKDVFHTKPDPVQYPVHALWPVMHKILWLIDKPASVLL